MNFKFLTKELTITPLVIILVFILTAILLLLEYIFIYFLDDGGS